MNPFARGGFFWLLAFESKLTWRTWLAAGKLGLWGKIGIFGLLGALGLTFGFFIAQLLASIGNGPSPDPLGVLLLSLALALTATLMLSQALLASTEIVYTRGDLDLLFSSPISPWTVMLVRACGIAMNVAILYLLLLGAVLIWTPLTGATGWLVMLPAVMALALVMTGLGLVLAKVLFKWIGPRRTRVTAQIAAALIGASIFLAMQTTNFLPRSEREEFWERVAQDLVSAKPDIAHPIWVPARAALGDYQALWIWLAVGVVTFVAAAFWFSRSFVADAAAAAAMGSRKRAAPTRMKRFGGGVASTVVRKEWRLLRRDPLLLSQVGMQIVYLLPLGFLIWQSASRGGSDAALTNGLLGGAFVLLASTLTGSLIWITASAEDAPDLIAAAPVPRERIELGKLIAAVTPVAALMLIPAIAIALNNPLHAAYVMAGVIAAAVSAGFIGICHQMPANRKEFRKQRSTSWVASLGQGFVAMSWSGAAGLALAGLEILSLIPILIAVGLVLALQESRPKQAA